MSDAVVKALHHLTRAMSESLREDVNVERARHEVQLAHEAIDTFFAPAPLPVAERIPPSPCSGAVESQPVDTTERGAGVVCTPTLPTDAEYESRVDRMLAERSQGVRKVRTTFDAPPSSDLDEARKAIGAAAAHRMSQENTYVCTETVNLSLLEARAETLADAFGKWPGDESEAELLAKLRAMDAPALDASALNDVARAAREASLALDTLTQRLKHALESAPPPAAAAAQLSTPLPADAPVPESAAESQADGGGADADLPPGWRVGLSPRLDGSKRWTSAHGGYVELTLPELLAEGSAAWFWQPSGRAVGGHAPTMLQAMCAALGITINTYEAGSTAWLGAQRLTAETRGIDDCARAALERYHARQQPEPECKCGRLGDVRSVNRWCALHGQEWQTLVEQQGAPELSARERGRE